MVYQETLFTNCDCGDCNSFPDLLTAWVHVTDRCNLRCAYCYLPHERVDMSLHTGKAIIEGTFRSAVIHGYRQVFLKYAGGEPLLRFSFIKALHSYAAEQADSHELALHGNILSNGTLLTPEILADISKLNLNLVISLDGIEKYHDQQRFYPDGRGSYADVIKGITLALSHNVSPFLSIVVTGQNAEGLPGLVDWALENSLPFNLSFARKNVSFLSCKEIQSEEERIITGMLSAYKVIEQKLPRRSLLNTLLDNANLSTDHIRPCSAGEHYLVFNCLGQVSKCQMEYENPVTNINVYDPLSEVQNSIRGVQNISIEDKEGCESCEWKYWCAGGCPLITYRATGRYDIKSPNCFIYKTLYPEVVRLEKLRSKKYALA